MGVILPGNDGDCLPDGTRLSDRYHTSRGGQPHTQETRSMVIGMWQLDGSDALYTPHSNAFRANHKFPHMDTCKRWIYLFDDVGHVIPCETPLISTLNGKCMALTSSISICSVVWVQRCMPRHKAVSDCSGSHDCEAIGSQACAQIRTSGQSTLNTHYQNMIKVNFLVCSQTC